MEIRIFIYLLLTVTIFALSVYEIKRFYSLKIKDLEKNIFDDVSFFFFAIAVQITKNIRESLKTLISLYNRAITLDRLFKLVKISGDLNDYETLIASFVGKYTCLLNSIMKKSEDLFSIIIFLAFLVPFTLGSIILILPSYGEYMLAILSFNLLSLVFVTKSFIKSIKWGR